MSRSLLSFLLLIFATVVLLIWHGFAIQILHLFTICYHFFMQALSHLISHHLYRQIIVTILSALLLALVPAFFYWIFTRRWFRDYMVVAWCAWFILMTLIVVRGI